MQKILHEITVSITRIKFLRFLHVVIKQIRLVEYMIFVLKNTVPAKNQQ